jgi:hypothetical protein
MGRNRVAFAGALAVVASGILATGATASSLDIKTAGKGVLSPGQPLVIQWSFKALGTECEGDITGELISNGQATDMVSFGHTITSSCFENFVADPFTPLPLRLTSKGTAKGSSVAFGKIGCGYLAKKVAGTFSLGSVAASDVLNGTGKRTKGSDSTCEKKVPGQETYSLFTGEEVEEEPVILG